MSLLYSLMGAPEPDNSSPGSLLYSLMEANQQAPMPRGNGGGGRGAPPTGDLYELFYPGNDPVGGHDSHLHVAAENVKRMLRRIDRMGGNAGFEVSEHPAFGGVDPVHSDNSYHYRNKAGDVNYVGGGRFDNETDALQWLAKWIRGRG